MKIIRQANPLILKILSTNNLDTNNMRLHDYCLVKKIDNNDLILNGITGELVLVDLNKDKDYLINNYYYVSNDFDEYKLIHELRTVLNIIGKTKTKSINSYTILTTTDCNARCFYCYEKGLNKIVMNNDTAIDVSNYILSHYKPNSEDIYKNDGSVDLDDNSNNKAVRLAWFGGEPLYNYEVINTICDNLANNNCNYYSTMISNGYIFNEELVKLAKEKWKLKHIQITLDGTKDIYNKTKDYIDCTVDPFDKVLHNIELLSTNDIKVSIRLNMTNTNYEDLLKLVDFLHIKFKDNKNVSVYSHLLYQDEIKKDSEYKKELYSKHKNLQEHMYSLGLKRSSLPHGIRSNACMADSLSSVVILPNGKIHSCEHINENVIWGSIYTNDTKTSLCHPKDNSKTTPLEYWEEKYEDLEQCKTCKNLPYCYRLKHCPNSLEYCDSYKQNEHLLQLEWAMLQEYNKKK